MTTAQHHCTAATDPRLWRLIEKPSLTDWQDDDALSLVEADALDVTMGKLKLKGLRTAVSNGEIAATRVAGKIWITKAAVNQAFAPKKIAKSAAFPMLAIEAPTLRETPPKQSLVLAKIASEKNATAGRRLRELS